MVGKYARKATSTFVDNANTTEQIVSKSRLGAGVAAAGGLYAASSAAESADSYATPVPDAASPTGMASDLAALGKQTAIEQTSGVDLDKQGYTGAGGYAVMGAGIGAGGAAAGVQFFSENSLGQSLDFAGGKNFFSAPEASSGRATAAYAKRQGARLGNATARGLGKTARGAPAVFAGAAAASVVKNTIDRTARKVARTGTPDQRRSADNALENSAQVSRGSPTSGVARSAGRSQGPGMKGSTVLALHKTGGRGAVFGG